MPKSIARYLPTDKCSVADCNGKPFSNYLCRKHRQRLFVYGDPKYFIPETYQEKFWVHVNKTDYCWLWTGAVAGKYGQCRSAPHTKIPAHRYSYILNVGEIPDGLYVCHRCDVRLCVRPDHLFLGTAKDNAQDMVAKGRWKGRNPRKSTNQVQA